MVARIPTPDSLTGTVVRLDQFTDADADADELACLILDPALHEQGFVMYDCPATPDEALQLVDVRSQAAIATVIFSIPSDEWPTVKANLEARLRPAGRTS